MPPRDITYLIEAEKTARRGKKTLDPGRAERLTKEYRELPPEAQERVYTRAQKAIDARARRMWQLKGEMGLRHREVAADVMKAIRAETRPQGAVPDLLRTTGRGSKQALEQWKYLQPKYRSRVGFEVHGAKTTGVPEVELPKVARAATERLAMRQAAKEVGNVPKTLKGFTGFAGVAPRLLGPLSIVGEVTTFLRERREGVKHEPPAPRWIQSKYRKVEDYRL